MSEYHDYPMLPAARMGNSLQRAKPNFLTNVKMGDCLVPDEDGGYSGCKVIATLGPQCEKVETLEAMLNAGMVGARVDLTWGDDDYHRNSLSNLQKASAAAKKLCCVLVDTRGRELLVQSSVDEGHPVRGAMGLSVQAEEQIILTSRKVPASPGVLPITYERLHEMCQPGDTIQLARYLASGAESSGCAYLEVIRVEGQDVVCIAQNEAHLDGLLTIFHVERSRTGVENIQNDLPVLSQFDQEFLQSLSKDFEIDFVILSYTRDAQDVKDTREFLDSLGMESTKILAKVGTRQAVFSFQGILNAADGIVISRGTLGLDCPPEKMATIQKTMIKACNLVGKPVIITRVVDTMCSTPRPTRAEATDVANAVLDGVDGFMLGAETVRGLYPEITISTICKISRSAERVFDRIYHCDHLMEVALDMTAGNKRVKMGKKLPPSVDSSHDDLQRLSKPPSHPNLSSSSNLRKVGFPSDAGVGSNGGAADDHPPKPPGMKRIQSTGDSKIEQAAQAMAQFGLGSIMGGLNLLASGPAAAAASTFTKLEALAAAAVTCADKIQASLILVYTHTGRTANLVAKYRPAVPILTLVVPKLVRSKGIAWRLEGRCIARQCLLTRGLLPMLSALGHNEDSMLQQAVKSAVQRGIVKAFDRVVCVQRIHSEYCLKVLSMDASGAISCPPGTQNRAVAQLPGVLTGYGLGNSDARRPQTLANCASMLDDESIRQALAAMSLSPGSIPPELGDAAFERLSAELMAAGGGRKH